MVFNFSIQILVFEKRNLRQMDEMAELFDNARPENARQENQELTNEEAEPFSTLLAELQEVGRTYSVKLNLYLVSKLFQFSIYTLLINIKLI